MTHLRRRQRYVYRRIIHFYEGAVAFSADQKEKKNEAAQEFYLVPLPFFGIRNINIILSFVYII